MFTKKFKATGKNKIAFMVVLTGAVTAYWLCLPEPLFHSPYSTLLMDRNNELLSARIASDGQWRFPNPGSVPEKFKKAIISFEDKRFYQHSGVDVLALARAFKLNVKHQEIVSGGSTISMQVIRLARHRKNRGLYDKLVETIMATRLEHAYSKEEIINLYVSYAPFGGNVVGLETASWKYFGVSADKLSWGETATLSVLPNCPGLIHPGKNRKALKIKRDKLLAKLYQTGIIDSSTCALAQNEELPDKPLPLPNHAPHLVERFLTENKHTTSVCQSTLELKTQCYAQKIIDKHCRNLSENKIHNAAAIIVETKTGNVLAYIGNTKSGPENGGDVDMVLARRSTGSILKPLLYAMMLNEGLLLPQTLVQDIPSWYGKYTPKNFTKEYYGAIPVDQAIARSLNVPAVKMLHQYGVRKFHSNLKNLGMTTLQKDPSHYGLTLILGGAETTLEDMAGIYSGMGQSLLRYTSDRNYQTPTFKKINYDYSQKEATKPSETTSLLNTSSIWYTFEAMNEVVRPSLENNWETYSAASKVAWKTGTSFGSRDAWAVGCTPEYTVAVWVGNATGEGRPGISGIEAAAPILFDIFSGLKRSDNWFIKPANEISAIKVCKKSGHKASDICTETKITDVPTAGLKTVLCPYHQLVYLDKTENNQVTGECYAPSEMAIKSYFRLPPIQELYYRSKNPDYITPPPFRKECKIIKSSKPEILYPTKNSKVYIPTNLDSSVSDVVFQANHSQHKTTLYWHIDDEFIGETKEVHDIAAHPSKGKHILTIITEDGDVLKQNFEVMEKL